MESRALVVAHVHRTWQMPGDAPPAAARATRDVAPNTHNEKEKKGKTVKCSLI